jgi:hypothetical protein
MDISIFEKVAILLNLNETCRRETAALRAVGIAVNKLLFNINVNKDHA